MSDTLMISVSGMRGIVGKDLTPELVARHAAALGAWAGQNGKPVVVLGRDARTSGPMFARAATAGLMSVGVEVIDVGVVPTPTVQLAVEHHHAGAGLILTASHNPIEWNALKFVGPDGIFLDGADGNAVRALAEQGPARTGWEGVGQYREDRDAIKRHLEQVLALPGLDVEAIRAKRFTVALDCVRGAGGTTIPQLLERLGCRVSGINLETDGRFPRAPEPLPENLGELSQLVRQSGAVIGLAVDPDVDRLALVDETGVRRTRRSRWCRRAAEPLPRSARDRLCRRAASRGRQSLDQPRGRGRRANVWRPFRPRRSG
jgi:phosphomannomutase